MAARSRRKRKSDSDGGFGIKILATLFVLLVMIGSFLLFVAWWFFERKARSLYKPNSIRDFDLNSEELRELKQHESLLSSSLRRLSQIDVEGKSVSKRQDGMYNERSAKGKQLNQEIYALTPRVSELKSTIHEIENLPTERLNEWAFYATMHLALRRAIMAYVASFGLFVWLQPKWVLQLSQTLQSLSLLDFYSSYPIAYGASVGSLVVSLTTLGIAFFVLRAKKIEELEEKADNITSGTATSLGKQNDAASFSVEHILSALSGLSHTELKNLVDEFGIKADKRSKSSILGAISIESPDVLNRIYSRFAI